MGPAEPKAKNCQELLQGRVLPGNYTAAGETKCDSVKSALNHVIITYRSYGGCVQGTCTLEPDLHVKYGI